MQKIGEEVEEPEREECDVPPVKLEWRERAPAVWVLHHAHGDIEGRLCEWSAMMTRVRNRELTSEARVRMCPPALALAIPQRNEAEMHTRKAEAPHNDALRFKLRLLPCIFDDRPIVVLLLRDRHSSGAYRLRDLVRKP